MSEEQSEDIKFHQWERNENNHTEKTLNYGDSGEVHDILQTQLQGFLIHMYVKRLQQQYFESLHDNNNGHETLIQIDFSEKFSPTAQSTIQSAHWTNNQVTYNQLTLLTAHLWFDKKSISNVCIWLLRS